MKIAYFDCFSGAAGDMWVGALLDAGLPLADVRSVVSSLGLDGVEVEAEKVMRAGLAGTHFRVRAPEEAAHRHLRDIRAILEKADLPDPVRSRADRVFEAIATVEAAVHDQSVESVHFHEVGAVDAIVDVVCACFGVHALGVERIYSSAVTTGTGVVECAHGTMPVPAPGALGNLVGVPVRAGGPAHECVTPTGAALLRVLVDEFEPVVTWVPESVGHGAGSRDHPDHPNLLRVTIGRLADAGSASRVWEISCNLDTATGEVLGRVLRVLLERGAVDAFATPIHMKKGRPGYMVTALVESAGRDEVARTMLEESSSLGLRMHEVDRRVLERWSEEVETELGVVRCKVARLPSGRVLRRPEADEVDRLAAATGSSPAEISARIARSL